MEDDLEIWAAYIIKLRKFKDFLICNLKKKNLYQKLEKQIDGTELY